MVQFVRPDQRTVAGADDPPGGAAAVSVYVHLSPVMCPRSAIYRLRRGNGCPTADVTVRLKSLNTLHARGRRRGRHVQISNKVISSTRKSCQPTHPYQHFDVSRLWFTSPNILLSNVPSLSNKVGELVTTLGSIRAGVVAFTEAYRRSSLTHYNKDHELFHHIHTRGVLGP